MAHHISFNSESVKLAMTNLLLEMESGGEGSLTNMESNVRRFVVNGQEQQNGGIGSLTQLTSNLRTSLAARSGDARVLYNELVEALDALELVISDLNAREDDQSQRSAVMLENVQELMQSTVTPPPNSTTPTSPAGSGTSGPSSDQLKDAGFGNGSGDASA